MQKRALVALGLVVMIAGGCGPELPPAGSYYDERIAPIFEGGCIQRAGGCHVASERGDAPGNLDLSSYDALMRRRDLLETYGPYPVPALLLRAGEPIEIDVETLDPPDPSRDELRSVRVRLDVGHSGGRGIHRGTPAERTLREWLADGYTRTGVPRERRLDAGEGCATGARPAPSREELSAGELASLERFEREAQPVLRASCASSDCHGAPLADLHLACGDDEAEVRSNWWISTQFLGAPVERSELLRRPIPIALGGAFHGGGVVFTGTDDAGYRALEGWARETVDRDPERFRETDASDGYRYFANRVIPVLVREGCMMLGCHSPIGLRMPLRGGSTGAFSTFARRRNHELLRNMLALESSDPTRSRVIEKNLLPPSEGVPGAGIAHRGAALFADSSLEMGDDLSRCADFDADAGPLEEIPSVCILARWHALERAEAVARGEVLASDAPRAVVWVERPPGIGTPTRFDEHRPGADLRWAEASADEDGRVSLGASRSLLEPCGLDPATTDVRGPAVSWDGSELAFAVRRRADEPLRLWRARWDGSECAPIAGVAPAADEASGMLLHDFDPAFAPDGMIVFASTRGDLPGAGHPERGPTRTPARLEPNANLYVFDPASGSLRQLTWLLDQELAPSLMGDGHVIYTAEKRAEDFHQLALRRHLLDGGDYHPLYASRDSVGFESATEVVELVDGRFAFVASALDAPDGAGAIAIVDRSIGPDQHDRDPGDRQYVRSLRYLARGAFRSPAPLPSGRLLVSCDLREGAAAPYVFDLCELEPRDGTLRVVARGEGRALIEAVAVFARSRRPIARSDGTEIDHPILVPGASDAIVRFTDFPMIATLMFANTRTGRPIDRRIAGIELFESLPPPAGATSFDTIAGERVVSDAFGAFYLERRSLGRAMLLADGSVRLRVPAGVPISYAMLDASGEPLELGAGMPLPGRAVQREAEQYYPGERITRSVPRRFFNSLCGGCHGSISGRELDVGVSLDVLSGASIDLARHAEPVSLMRE